MSNDSYVEQNTMRNVLNIFMQISVPYIIIVSIIGICGNFLTIIMLSKRSLSKNFNNCTLIALALTDLLFNFALVSRCINDLTQSNSENLCRLLSFLSHLAELLSACFTAQFTAQRFIAVRFPLSVFIEKKIHLIHYLIVSLLIIFGIVYCLALVQNNAYENCHEELELKWFISDAVLSFLLPFTIIIILNFLIIFHLKKSFQNNPQTQSINRQSENLSLNFRKKNSSLCDIMYLRNLVSQSQRSTDLVLVNGRIRSIDLSYQRPSVRSKTQSYRVTRMLIIVSTCFLLLNAPSHICTIGLKIFVLKQPILIDNSNQILVNVHDSSKQHNQTLSNNIDSDYMTRRNSNQNDVTNNFKWMEFFYLLVIITQHVSYASYSINFFLYSFCGIKIRRELVRLVSKQQRQLIKSRSITAQNIL